MISDESRILRLGALTDLERVIECAAAVADCYSELRESTNSRSLVLSAELGVHLTELCAALEDCRARVGREEAMLHARLDRYLAGQDDD